MFIAGEGAEAAIGAGDDPLPVADRVGGCFSATRFISASTKARG